MNDDIVPRLRIVWTSCSQRINDERNAAADEIERLRNELAARCGDARPGAHTAGPSETFIPEAL